MCVCAEPKMKMADGCNLSGGKGAHIGKSGGNLDLLLHPELLSRDFLLLTLQEKKIPVENEKAANRDCLTELYLQHVIPLPQRALPNSRWGRRMQKSRACQSATNSQKRCSWSESSRKRPLIVFDGSSTSTSIKLKKADDGSGPVDRLKPPPSGNLTNTIRRLSGSSTNSSSDGSNRSAVDLVSGATEKQCSEAPIHRSPSGNGMSPPPTSPPGGTAVVKLKRQAPKEGESEDAADLKSSEPKRKIQHVTWP